MRKYSAIFGFLLSAFTVHAQFTNGQAARAVLGQENFTAGSASPSQYILGGVSGLAYSNGVLYVADSNRVAATPQNSRVMAFGTAQLPNVHDNLLAMSLPGIGCALCGFPATFSLGQSTFTPADPTTGFAASRSQSGFSNATGVATDGQHFAVADTDNNRVLIWNTVPTAMNQPADIVVGQTDFTSFKSPQAVNSTSLRGPQSVWFQNNKLFVADTQNHRILIWNSVPTQNNQAADLVLGQPDMNHANQPAPTTANPVAAANQLLNPTAVTSDGVHLFVADLGFNRVLIWNSIPAGNDQPADVVVGQPDMVSTAANNSTVCTGYATGTLGQCQTSLNYPRYALSDGTRLFIADGGNDRVVIFDHIPTSNGAAFNEVLGQQDFVQDVVSSATITVISTAVDNTGGVDLTPTPQALALDGTNLYVSDPYNRRVLVFTPGDISLPHNSVVNWASEIVRQEGIVAIGGTPTANDTVSITIAGTAYTYTVKSGDTLDVIAQGLVALINANSGDPNVTALFAGVSSGSVYLSSKGTDLGYDTITLAAASSNTANETTAVSGAYLSAGTAATGAIGMLVEINGTNLADQTVTANANGQNSLPNTLGGVQVYMDGYGAPVLKVSPTQIISQIPYSFGNRNSTSVYVRSVRNDGSVTSSNPVPVYIAPANPGIFNAPVYGSQPRPWPISMAFHQSGNPTSVVSIDGTVTAGNVATVTIQGTAYNYTVVAADTLTTIAQNLANLINATDPNVTASLGSAFTRIVLTAKQPGAAGNGITIAGSASTSATVTVTAYTSTTCCVVTPGSPISSANPAAPGELITITAVGLGAITDSSGTAQNFTVTGAPYAGPTPNIVTNSLSSLLGATTAQVISAGLPTGSYGTYSVQLLVPSSATTNTATPLYIAQNAFVSNIVTLPVGPATLYTGGPVTAPVTSDIHQNIDSPASGSTVSGMIQTGGWAVSASSSVTSVVVAVDGQTYGSGTRGVVRNDVCALYSSSDCPATGWFLPMDTTNFSDGAHTFTTTVTTAAGTHSTIAQAFNISNGTSNSSNSQQASIDLPGANSTFQGSAIFAGWAVNRNSTIASVALYVDGTLTGNATYGATRPDVCALYPGPGGCDLGWTFRFDTTKLANGSHTLVMKALSANGQVLTLSKAFQVSNFSTYNSTQVSIDSPSASAGAFSGTLQVGGWAFDDNYGVASVSVSVDGVSYGNAGYGSVRTDVCTVYPGRPNCPNVGFNATLDTTALADGQHTLVVTVISGSSQTSTFSRTFSVSNLGSASSIDLPANGSTVSGSINTGGWALSSVDHVTRVQMMVDGVLLGDASYGFTRSDACALYTGGVDCPHVGWNGNMDTTKFGNGTHVFEITATTAGGKRFSASNNFIIANGSSGPGRITIDVPNSNAVLGRATFSGWAINDNTAVSSLSVTIDGVPYGLATYGDSRPDVCALYPGRANCPNAGWRFAVDTNQFADGLHTVVITENNADGTFYSQSQTFTVGNYSGANPYHVAIDSPQSNALPSFGTINIAGWALNLYSGIATLTVSIDGIVVGNASYGSPRSDACAIYPAAGCPNVGFNFGFDTNLIANGTHTVAVTAVPYVGQSYTASQPFTVSN